MIRLYRHKFATLLVLCLGLAALAAVPAFAEDVAPPTAPDGSVVTSPADPATPPADPATPPADPATPPSEPATPPSTGSGDQTTPPEDPSGDSSNSGSSGSGSSGSTGSTTPTGPTGSTGGDGPVADNTNDPKTEQPQQPAPTVDVPATTPPPTVDEKPGVDGDITGETDKTTSRPKSQVGGDGAGQSNQILNTLANGSPAASSGVAGTAKSAARGTTDQLERNAENGVAASLVVTRIISEVPAWVFWALAALAAVALAGLGLFMRERLRRRSAEHEALVDELTMIANRKAFDRRLDLEWRRADRYGRSLGLMVMDLDGFKQVNDQKGHAAGDKVLRDVAQALADRMRDTDLVARIGGDEFAIICPETGINELMTIRRQLSDQVAKGLTEKVGLSVGVAEFVPGDENALSILARADESMYRVKRGDAAAAVTA